MTLLLDRVEQKPQLHALVVGIGAYDHLVGGDKDRLLDYDMPQLGSPVPSALAMLDWLKAFRHPTVSIGSVEALLSPAQAVEGWGAAPIVTSSARIDEFVLAVSDWFGRCHRHEGNIALFFFCGHGLWRISPALLAADFGATPRNPFDQALDFDALKNGMGSCLASTQLFFVDACQQTHPVLASHLTLNARVPIPPLDNAPPRSDHLVLHATAPLERAYGLAGQPSRFTTALLASLRGLAGQKKNGCWSVTTSKLGEAAVSTLRRLCLADQAPEQRATPGGSPRGAIICDLGPAVPVVPLAVRVLPNDANVAAQLSVLKGMGVLVKERKPQSGTWEVEIDAGVYTVAARFAASSTFRDAQHEEVYVLPPGADEIMEIG